MREESWTTLLLNTFTVLLKRRREKERLLLVLLVISFVLFEMTFPVDDNLLYIHFKDKFNWNEEDYTNFQAFWTLCMVIGEVFHHNNCFILILMLPGQFILTPVLQNILQWSAPVIGMLSYISKGSYYLALASSNKQWMVNRFDEHPVFAALF